MIETRNAIRRKKENYQYLNKEENKLADYIKLGLHSEVRHMLLENPDLYSTLDEKKNNLLHLAAKNNSTEVFKMLVQSSKGSRLLVQKNKVAFTSNLEFENSRTRRRYAWFQGD